MREFANLVDMYIRAKFLGHHEAGCFALGEVLTELGSIAHHVAVRVGQEFRDLRRELLGEVHINLVVDDVCKTERLVLF